VFGKNWQGKMMKIVDKIMGKLKYKMKLLLYFFLQTE